MELIELKKLSNDYFSVYRDSQATGSEQTFILNPLTGQKYVYTEGVRCFFINKKAYWIRELIFSFTHLINKLDEEFIVFNFFKNTSNANEVIFLATDGNENILFHQKIPYSDLDINVELYLCGNSEKRILLLPSEY